MKSGGTRAVQKGAKKALPLIITNSKAKKKGAHFEHLNYHSLSILIVVYHDLLSDVENGHVVFLLFYDKEDASTVNVNVVKQHVRDMEFDIE